MTILNKTISGSELLDRPNYPDIYSISKYNDSMGVLDSGGLPLSNLPVPEPLILLTGVAGTIY
jgi:hypothetical protein